MSAFITLFTGLFREGPGSPDDVAWATKQLALKPDAAICDAGCGTGGDIGALLDAAPHGTLTAIDRQAEFISALKQDWAGDDRVWAETGDMADLNGEYDLIWSAGAVYFIGITQTLTAWRDALRPSGAVAFSHPCHFADDPSPEARAFWGKHPADDPKTIADQIRAAGYETVATRRVANAGWTLFYTGLAARAAQLRPGADAEMTVVLDRIDADIALWPKVRSDTGYLLSVVRPI